MTARSDWPRISIVTPSFHQGRFLEETILSVIGQEYPQLEYMIIDGGSADESPEIIKQYQDYLTYWVSEPDRGQSHAINKGLYRARGEYFRYLNSDDLLPPGALFEAARAFASHPEADVIHGECIFVDREGRQIGSRLGSVEDLLQFLRIWEFLHSDDRITQEALFFKRETLLKVGGFREDLHYVMDHDLWLRLFARGCKFQQVPVPLGICRLHEGQKSARGKSVNELLVVLTDFLERHGDLLSEDDKSKLISDIPREFSFLKLAEGTRAYRLRSYGEFINQLVSALVLYPRIAASPKFWASLAFPLSPWVPGALRERVNSLPRKLAHPNVKRSVP